jgi:hypothetical protein
VCNATRSDQQIFVLSDFVEHFSLPRSNNKKRQKKMKTISKQNFEGGKQKYCMVSMNTEKRVDKSQKMPKDF